MSAQTSPDPVLRLAADDGGTLDVAPLRGDEGDERRALQAAEAILAGETDNGAGLADAFTLLALTMFRDGHLTQALMFARAAYGRAARERGTAVAPARPRLGLA